MRNTGLVLIFILSASPSRLLRRGGNPPRYALILKDPSIAEVRKNATQAVAEDHRQKIGAAQATLRSELARQNFTVTGSVQTVAERGFRVATPDQVAAVAEYAGRRSRAPLAAFPLRVWTLLYRC